MRRNEVFAFMAHLKTGAVFVSAYALRDRRESGRLSATGYPPGAMACGEAHSCARLAWCGGIWRPLCCGAVDRLRHSGRLVSVRSLGSDQHLILSRLGADRPGVRGRDAFSAAVLSLAFNLCFLVIFPVTIDRSVSVFVLGQMAAHADRAYSADQMTKVFSDVYVGEDHQIDRRLREQLLSGNVERIGAGYRISARGKAFIQTSKLIAWMFEGDTRFVSPSSVDPLPMRARTKPSN